MGSCPSELSIVTATSARPSGARPEVPAKITSSILPPRSDLTPCSPITQASASTTLDLPEPFGPTTHVMPGSKLRVVAEANDLNPRSVSVFKCTDCPCVYFPSKRGVGTIKQFHVLLTQLSLSRGRGFAQPLSPSRDQGHRGSFRAQPLRDRLLPPVCGTTRSRVGR